VELRNQLNLADDGVLRCAEILDGSRVLQDRLAAHIVDLMIQERSVDVEPGHVSCTESPDVPVAGGHGDVLLTQHGIEDRLARRSDVYSRHPVTL